MVVKVGIVGIFVCQSGRLSETANHSAKVSLVGRVMVVTVMSVNGNNSLKNWRSQETLNHRKTVDEGNMEVIVCLIHLMG